MDKLMYRLYLFKGDAMLSKTQFGGYVFESCMSEDLSLTPCLFETIQAGRDFIYKNGPHLQFMAGTRTFAFQFVPVRIKEAS